MCIFELCIEEKYFVIVSKEANIHKSVLHLSKYVCRSGDFRFVPANSCTSPQSDTFLANHQNAAQRVLDGMSYMIQSVSEYSAGPTKAVAAWLTDQVAPPYWRPNNEIAVSGGRKGPNTEEFR